MKTPRVDPTRILLAAFNREFEGHTHFRHLWIIGLNPYSSVVILVITETLDRLITGNELDFQRVKGHCAPAYRFAQSCLDDLIRINLPNSQSCILTLSAL